MTVPMLLVDDEADSLELFRQSFRREIRRGDYAIDFAASADEALRMLLDINPSPPQVLLSDINMPGMNGLDLLSEVKRRWPQVHVIMISAYGDDANRRRAAGLGASHFLSKPIDFTELKRTLADYTAGQAT